MRTIIVLGLTVLGLVGCATSEIVHLRNATGDTVKCGPFTTSGNAAIAAQVSHQKLRDCITDYQRQGYERVPGP